MPRQLRSDEPYSKFLLFKGHWERKYPGEKYLKTGKDLKFAKELVEIEDAEIVRRLQIYFKEEWYGENCRHSLPAFVQNLNTFVPRRKEGGPALIDCPLCGKKHPANEDCTKGKAVPMPKEVSDTLTLLVKKMSVK